MTPHWGRTSLHSKFWDKLAKPPGKHGGHKGKKPHGPHRPKSAPPSLGWITFNSWGKGGNYSCTALLGDTVPQVTDGYGGWTTEQRARRQAFTFWTGPNPLTLDIPIMFDGWSQNHSQEYQIHQLELMAGIDGTEPPLVIINAAGAVPHDFTRYSKHDWVISQIQWGDADRRANGDRLRQAATVTVMKYISDDTLADISPATTRRGKKGRGGQRGKAVRGAKKHEYVVKDRETLETIAAKRLGKASRWREIKKLNPRFRDPKKIVPIGTILRMPK